MRGPPLFPLPLCALLAGPSWAADCGAAVDQAGLGACAARQFERADRSLDDAHRSLLARAHEGGRAALREAESRWTAFRDAPRDCEMRGSLGGSAHPLARPLRLADLTRAQAARLARQGRCEDGDLSCSR